MCYAVDSKSVFPPRETAVALQLPHCDRKIQRFFRRRPAAMTCLFARPRDARGDLLADSVAPLCFGSSALENGNRSVAPRNFSTKSTI